MGVHHKSTLRYLKMAPAATGGKKQKKKWSKGKGTFPVPTALIHRRP